MNKIITVYDKMQQGYQYELSCPMWKRFDPEFFPDLTPQQMLELGIFGGKYMTDCKDEFPKEWFVKAKLSANKKDPLLNFFGVDASLPIHTWKEKWWIYPDDPRWWFQRYCRYYMWRRIPEEDKRQIKRRKAIKRHIWAIKKNCNPGDRMCRRKQRQALLHWAYDSRKF